MWRKEVQIEDPERLQVEIMKHLLNDYITDKSWIYRFFKFMEEYNSLKKKMRESWKEYIKHSGEYYMLHEAGVEF